MGNWVIEQKEANIRMCNVADGSSHGNKWKRLSLTQRFRKNPIFISQVSPDTWKEWAIARFRIETATAGGFAAFE